MSRSSLACFADNVRAIHLYQSLGFEDFGCTPRAFRLKDGTYHDEAHLVKFLKSKRIRIIDTDAFLLYQKITATP